MERINKIKKFCKEHEEFAIGVIVGAAAAVVGALYVTTKIVESHHIAEAHSFDVADGRNALVLSNRTGHVVQTLISPPKITE